MMKNENKPKLIRTLFKKLKLHLLPPPTQPKPNPKPQQPPTTTATPPKQQQTQPKPPPKPPTTTQLKPTQTHVKPSSTPAILKPTTTPIKPTTTPINLKPESTSTNLNPAPAPTKPKPKPKPTPEKPNPRPTGAGTKPKLTQTPTNPKLTQTTAPTKPNPTPPPPPPQDSPARCCGITREGKPCSRKPMKSFTPSAGQPPIDLTERLDHLDLILAASNTRPVPPAASDQVPRFCFQHHEKASAQPGGFFGKSVWIEFSNWIAAELPEDVKISLKTEMAKQPTEKDRSERGYLYCQEMRPGGGRGGGTYIKVGRSTRPVARLGEWSKQCRSRTPIVRGIFPELASQDASGASAPCYLDGLQTVAPSGIRFHRKWERLALLELAGWAFLQNHRRPSLPCLDCNKLHLELFQLDAGSYERFVKPMILKWQKWCTFAYL